jgi:hypothetical protein
MQYQMITNVFEVIHDVLQQKTLYEESRGLRKAVTDK